MFYVLFFKPSMEIFSKNNNLFIKSNNRIWTLCTHYTNISSFNAFFVGHYISFLVKMRLVGLGLRVLSLEEKKIHLRLGFSHDVVVIIPPNIKVFSPKRDRLIVTSNNLSFLISFCSKLRDLKSPEPYKGKGIRFAREFILLKEGKKK